MNLVSLRRVEKRFGAKTALAGVDLEFTSGTILGFLGRTRTSPPSRFKRPNITRSVVLFPAPFDRDTTRLSTPIPFVRRPG